LIILIYLENLVLCNTKFKEFVIKIKFEKAALDNPNRFLEDLDTTVAT